MGTLALYFQDNMINICIYAYRFGICMQNLWKGHVSELNHLLRYMCPAFPAVNPLIQEGQSLYRQDSKAVGLRVLRVSSSARASNQSSASCQCLESPTSSPCLKSFGQGRQGLDVVPNWAFSQTLQSLLQPNAISQQCRQNESLDWVDIVLKDLQ